MNDEVELINETLVGCFAEKREERRSAAY